jgi:acetyl-CoA acyltransferase
VSQLRDAVIIDGIRTPAGRGKPGGALSGVHPIDLLAGTLDALAAPNGLQTMCEAGGMANATIIERL